MYNIIRQFIRYEASSGILLFIMAVIALILSNSPLHHAYEALITIPISLGAGNLALTTNPHVLINDCLMPIFFFLVGLEIKREILEGELSSAEKILLPGVAAIGGMLVPALIYVAFNSMDLVALRGWAIPTATDIAFALGVLMLLGSRIPLSLRVLLSEHSLLRMLECIIRQR